MFGKHKKVPPLDVAEAEEILNLVFIDCGEELVAAPMEELTSYSLYRKESFRLQRAVLLVALIFFGIVPIYFVEPECETSYVQRGERGLPVYTINVTTPLPVQRVTAVLGGYRLPVYEVTGHTYTIEPTSNGVVDLTVELFSGQSISEELEVRNADVTAPSLVTYNITEGDYVLTVSDGGVGVNFEDIYAELSTGEKVAPIGYDREAGTVTFGADAAGAVVYIPDYFSNTLRLQLLG